jgi:hypothetical protein
MLGDLPLRSIPRGSAARVTERLNAREAGSFSRGVRAAAVGLAVAMTALVTWLGVLTERGPSVRTEVAPATEQTTDSPKTTRGRRPRSRQHVRPHTTTTIPVDTSLPREVIQQGHPKLPSRNSDATPGMPVTPRSR